MGISKSWSIYVLLSLIFHAVLLAINQGFWVELDSPTFVDLAKTKSLSFCTPIGYPVFLFIFGIGAKFLWIPIFIQIVLRSLIVGLITHFLAKKYALSPVQSLILWIIFHIEPQQIYYNSCLMAESLLVSVCMAQWYVWQQYQLKQNKTYLWFLYILIGLALYLKPIAIVSLILLTGYSLLKLKSRYKILVAVILVYGFFYVSVSSVYYWRYSTFEPDIFKGILFWNNASVLTPTLKKDHFLTKNPEVNTVLERMYQRKDCEYAFEQNDNRIFEDSSFTQQYIQLQIKQGKTYREAIVHTNNIFGKVAKSIVVQYPFSFVKAYIIPNTKEWINSLYVPHNITYLVPTHITQICTHAKTYTMHKTVDFIHSAVKLIFLIFTIVSTFVVIFKKQKNILQMIIPIWLFILIYVCLNIILHSLEYRYIYPIIAGAQVVAVILVASYLSSADKSV